MKEERNFARCQLPQSKNESLLAKPILQWSWWNGICCHFKAIWNQQLVIILEIPHIACVLCSCVYIVVERSERLLGSHRWKNSRCYCYFSSRWPFLPEEQCAMIFGYPYFTSSISPCSNNRLMCVFTAPRESSCNPSFATAAQLHGSNSRDR